MASRRPRPDAYLGNAGDRDTLLAHPDAIELPAEQIAKGRVFALEWEGAIVGFAAVEPRTDGDSELESLFVDPHMQRRGIGRALVEYCADFARIQGSQAIHVIGNPACKNLLCRVWVRGDRNNGNSLRPRTGDAEDCLT